MGREEMRAADADRERVVERLRTALEEGRLELHEFDERLQSAYAAKTYGDLDALLTDLPVTAPLVPAGAAVAGPARRPTGEWLVHVWQGWVPTALVLTAIWVVSGMGGYWPLWVIGPWGVILVWQSIGGLVSGAPRRMVEERTAKALEDEERKRKRRAFEEERIARGTPSAKEEKGDKSGSSAADTPDSG